MTDSEEPDSTTEQPVAAAAPPPFTAPAPQQPIGVPGQPWYGATPPPQYGPPPGYPPPYQYGYAGYLQMPGATSGMAIAAMVCGICGFLCLVPGVIGIVLGAVSLSQMKRTQQTGRGMAITGIVMGSLWLIAFVLLLALGNDNNSYQGPN